jgi:hypothetical protein
MTSEELKILKQIEDLLRVLVRVSLSEKLRSIRAHKQRKFLYENTGLLPVKELSRRTGFSAGKISGIWQEWEDSGLLIKDGKQYRRAV